MNECGSCGKSKPSEWCWEARVDCPFGKPPRHLDVRDLWTLIVDQERRITALEAACSERR